MTSLKRGESRGDGGHSWIPSEKGDGLEAGCKFRYINSVRIRVDRFIHDHRWREIGGMLKFIIPAKRNLGKHIADLWCRNMISQPKSIHSAGFQLNSNSPSSPSSGMAQRLFQKSSVKMQILGSLGKWLLLWLLGSTIASSGPDRHHQSGDIRDRPPGDAQRHVQCQRRGLLDLHVPVWENDVNPLFPFPDRLSSLFSALGEKANS